MLKWLLLLFSPLSLAAQPAVNDPALDSIEKYLPENWVMERSGNEVIISCKDSVWLCEQLTINSSYESHDTTLPGGAVPSTVISQARNKKSKLIMRYRLDTLWTTTQWNKINHNNDSILQCMRSLPQKIGIDERFLYGITRMDDAPPDLEEKKRTYFREKRELEKLLIPCPEYSTSKYSLILIEYKGEAYRYGIRVIAYPPSYGRSCNFIRQNLLPRYCVVSEKKKGK